MHAAFKTTLSVIIGVMVAHASAQVTVYEENDFQGRFYTTQQRVFDFSRTSFNDRASSIVVVGERWEVCEDTRFSGRCVVLRPGRYPALTRMGLNDRISSMRPISASMRIADYRYAPEPDPVYDNRRRNRERLFEVELDSVRAVLAVSGQHCWMAREDVVQNRDQQPNVGGAVAGALIGGILGHQVGGGVGKDLATVGGVVAGAALGSKVGRDGNDQQVVGTRSVQRCANDPGRARPAYWDVSYNFRGQDHRVQLSYAPGATITVNRDGEPRN